MGSNWCRNSCMLPARQGCDVCFYVLGCGHAWSEEQMGRCLYGCPRRPAGTEAEWKVVINFFYNSTLSPFLCVSLCFSMPVSLYPYIYQSHSLPSSVYLYMYPFLSCSPSLIFCLYICYLCIRFNWFLSREHKRSFNWLVASYSALWSSERWPQPLHPYVHKPSIHNYSSRAYSRPM